jgi:hypothetical protein
MNQDVFLSILSMDSYNRGGAGLNLDSPSLGTAVIGAPGQNAATGFFATSYAWNGKTVISYRGTDFGLNLSMAADLINGWLIGVGSFVEGDGDVSGQLADAVNYYMKA